MPSIDLTNLPWGRTYEDSYGAWLDIFKQVAESEESVSVMHPPHCWVSLLYYLGATVYSPASHCPEDYIMWPNSFDDTVFNTVSISENADSRGRLRELVEWHSAMRPELVDALFKSDTQWKTVKRRHQYQKEFKVTCNGSFYRPEVLSFIKEKLFTYKPTKTKCVLVPCAADKPYPAPLHKAVREIIPDDYEMIIVTGTLGLVPEGLWADMPLYDAGLPNENRIEDFVFRYFSKNVYDSIVVYCDYNNEAISEGLDKVYVDDIAWPDLNPNAIWVNKGTYKFYLPLTNPEYLDRLRAVDF